MDWRSVKLVLLVLAGSGFLVQPAVVLHPAEAVAMPRYRITISGPDRAAMLDLAGRHDLRIFDHGIRFAADTGYTVAAFAAPDEIRKLRQDGYLVVQHEDADEAGKLRQREVGRGNRYTQSTDIAATGYLNVAEVEAAILKAAAAPYSGIAELITLPSKTWQGRQCHALKIASGRGPGRPGVYFLGGVHAREWGSSDILINFIEKIEQAYLNNTALTFGGKTFSATDIKSIVDTLDVVIFPQANPDGRNYSMTVEHDWRKNLRPAPPRVLPECRGVDINRNYDFLWDFHKCCSPSFVTLTSYNPCSYYYHGESVFSEPETRNARWIVDEFPNTRFFIDLHSYGPRILYRWGDCAEQTGDPDMNFSNPAYDSLRGVAGQYSEYIPGNDLTAAKSLAAVLRDGLKAVRGTDYAAGPAFGLYATVGASDDYLYSRHFVDSGQAKIVSYTLEWGTQFQPPWQEMRQIIDEVTAGLLAFCLEIVALTRTQQTV
jgi:carboxypeptidase T